MAITRQRSLFFVVFALVMLTTVAVGFGPTLYLRPMLGTIDWFGPSLPPYLVVHGLVLTLWFAFFVVQTLFVSTGRIVTHRQVGVAGAALAIAVVLSSLVTIHPLGVASRGFGW